MEASYTSPSAIVAALPYAVAVFSANGRLQQANEAFFDLMAQLDPTGGPAACDSLEHLGRCLGVGFDDTPTSFSHRVAGQRTTVQVTLTPMADGCRTFSAVDVSQQSLAERKAERSQKVALIALADLAENRDTDTGEHILRVARLTHEVTRRLLEQGHYLAEITDDFRRNVGLASILHDIGKVGTPDSILLKAGPLTPPERAEMELHAARGAAILRKASAMLAGSHQFRLAAEIAEHHHERWDGAGYPHRLKGQDIPLSARIVAAADVYDALASDRPYKTAWPQERVLDFFADQSGSHFDPLIAQALVDVVMARAHAHTIPWTEGMSVGNDSVDHDHRILLALVNQVSSPGTREDPIAIEFVLDELLGYTASHFSREEALMERIDYPELEEHRAIHQAMLNEVRQLQRRMVSFTPTLGDDLTRFLGDWLTRHILIEDQRYSPYLWDCGDASAERGDT
ncbi:MAG: bacteriohemerythrin [Magnetospirillum sp.]|nr:bacteriohemerythrin [Magnetospirillum sp.]